MTTPYIVARRTADWSGEPPCVARIRGGDDPWHSTAADWRAQCEALTVCRWRCPVRFECGLLACDSGETSGIMAGFQLEDPAGREALRGWLSDEAMRRRGLAWADEPIAAGSGGA